jgi:hypothetical protein
MNKSRKFAALIFITFCLSLFSDKLMAQDADYDEPHGMYLEEPRIFSVGLVAGANFTQVDGDNFAGYHKFGANVGGIGYIQLRKRLALSWEFLYTEKGAKSDMVKVTPRDSVFILKYDVKLNYAEVPVMINYYDKRKSHFSLGVSYSRLVSSSEKLVTAPTTSVDLNKYPFARDNFDFLAGANLHLWKGLYLNIRFQYSLMPVRSSSPPGFSRAQDQYNNLWTVRLMYLLR